MLPFYIHNITVCILVCVSVCGYVNCLTLSNILVWGHFKIMVMHFSPHLMFLDFKFPHPPPPTYTHVHAHT